MQPNLVLLADICDGVDRVERAVDGTPGGAVDEEGQMALALVANDQLFQLLRDHAALVITRDLHAVLGSKADRGCTAGNRVVML